MSARASELTSQRAPEVSSTDPIRRRRRSAAACPRYLDCNGTEQCIVVLTRRINGVEHSRLYITLDVEVSRAPQMRHTSFGEPTADHAFYGAVVAFLLHL